MVDPGNGSHFMAIFLLIFTPGIFAILAERLFELAMLDLSGFHGSFVFLAVASGLGFSMIYCRKKQHDSCITLVFVCVFFPPKNEKHMQASQIGS